jgi:DNA (cytosine-5)-methyltransferase 1
MIAHRFTRDNGNLVREFKVRNKVFTSETEDRADSGLDASEAWWQSFLRGAGVRSDTSLRARALTIVDAFSGCGGFSLGVAQACNALGWLVKPVAAIDTDRTALSVYADNFPTALTIAKNVSGLVDYHVNARSEDATFAYPPEVIEEGLRSFVGETDIFLAGPPCEGHSNLNNHTRRADPRNLLYMSAIALGVALRATVIAVENVPEVNHDRHGVVGTAKALLQSVGYRFLDWDTLSADALGAAQTRKRFFLIAVAPWTKFIPVRLRHVRTSLVQPARTLSWAIGDLLDIPPTTIMDQSPTLSDDNLRRIDHLFDNDLYDLPDAVRPECHQAGTSYKSVYGRLRWDRPSQTITTGFLTPGRGRYIHPLRRRVLTPREAARLQSFPDSFRFLIPDAPEPGRVSLGKWIGDAVPPILGYAATMGALTALSS